MCWKHFKWFLTICLFGNTIKLCILFNELCSLPEAESFSNVFFGFLLVSNKEFVRLKGRSGSRYGIPL